MIFIHGRQPDDGEKKNGPRADPPDGALVCKKVFLSNGGFPCAAQVVFAGAVSFFYVA
jgi:hypothetical protein